MTAPPPPLPDDAAAAIDRWIADPDDEGLDAISAAVADLDHLDGDRSDRERRVWADLALDAEGPLSDADLDALEAAVPQPAPDAADEQAREAAVRRALAPPKRAAPASPVRTTSPQRRWIGVAAGLALAAAALVWLRPGQPPALVSEAEATAPLAPLVLRGDAPTAGPSLRLVSPDQPVSGAFELVVEADAAPGGPPIDPGSLRIIYARGTRPDLSERLHGGWMEGRYTARGIRLPPGDHPLEIELLDAEQQAARLQVEITAH